MENNKLIAEFMDLETPNGVYYEHLTKDGHRSKLTHFMLLEYHESWDWLMPVVEKCLEKHNNLIDGRDVIDTSYPSIAQALQVVSLKETYQAVVNFIKTYNNEK